MTQVSQFKGFFVDTTNEIGTALKITQPITDAKVNIKTFWAMGFGDDAKFFFITEDNAKAIEALGQSNFGNLNENDFLVAFYPDEMGSANDLSNKMADAGINIQFLYSTIFDNKPAIVFSTDDNQKAADLF